MDTSEIYSPPTSVPQLQVLDCGQSSKPRFGNQWSSNQAYLLSSQAAPLELVLSFVNGICYWHRLHNYILKICMYVYFVGRGRRRIVAMGLLHRKYIEKLKNTLEKIENLSKIGGVGGRTPPRTHRSAPACWSSTPVIICIQYT